MIFLITLAIVVKQSWHTPPSFGFNSLALDSWYRWFKDECACSSSLAKRVSTIEKQQHKLSILEEQLQHMATLETSLKQMETRLKHLATLEKRISLMENGTVVAKKRDTAWKLTDIFSRMRQYRQPITFSQPFSHPPRIVLGITMIDLPREKVRFLAYAEKIRKQGFTLVFETRSDSRVEEVQVDWLAFSSGTTEVKPLP